MDGPSGMVRLDGAGEAADAELISAVRGGDTDAYGELFGRHVGAARRLARQLVPPADADDLVSEAFAKVLVALQRGGGPDLAFRAYLLTAVRRLHVDRIRANARVQTTDDLTALDPGVPFRDTAVEGFENLAAARAFASLPERWQMVLWHTEVEGQKPGDIAPLLGMSANSVSALAYRAREGLRQAFLSMHVQELDEDACTWVHQNLGAYVRGGCSRRDAARIEEHLAECRRCTGIYLELTEVNSGLSGVIAPLLLGAAASAYVAAAGAGAGLGLAGLLAAGKGAAVAALDRGRDLVLAHGTATAAAGVAVATAVGGAVYLSVDRQPGPPTAREPVVAGPPGADGPGPSERSRQRRPDATTAPGTRAPAPAAAPQQEPATAAPVVAPASAEPPAPPATDPGPTSPPAPPPAPPPGPPSEPAPDLAVSAEVSSSPGGVHRIGVRVAGVEPGTSGTLTIEGEGVAATLTLDDRCRSVTLSSGECHAEQSTTFDFSTLAPLPAGATLVFTVVPDGAPEDADPSDNRTTVTLGP